MTPTQQEPTPNAPAPQHSYEEAEPQTDYDREEDFCLAQNDETWDLYRSGQISRREFQISMQELEDICGWS